MSSVIVQIDRSVATPVRTQIANAYAQAIREGGLGAGETLPSVRGLSGRLGVTPVTVAAAYRELCELRLVVAMPRSGFRVAGAASPPLERKVFQLNRIEPDLRIHPVAACARLIADLAAADPGIGGYADYRGEMALREAIAGLDRELGIVTDSVRGVLMTSGAQQALSLLGRMLPSGACVAVESPCYPGVRLAFSERGRKLVPVCVDAEGPVERDVQAIAESGRIAAFYCCPNYANPTGRSWSEAARRRVVEAASRGGCLLIEDDYLGDLDPAREALPRLARLASEYPGARVVRIHTFSKTLLPALRLASVTADPETIDRLLALKVADDLGCSSFLQRALARFISAGDYQRHLERVRPHYREVREVLRQAMGEAGPYITFSPDPSGFCMLGRLDRTVDTGRFLAECARSGVMLTPGADYWGDAVQGSDCFRMGFGALSPDEVPVVLRRLGEAAAAVRNASEKWSLL